MKKLNIIIVTLFVGLTGCATGKPEPKLCKVIIPEPSQAELNKANANASKRGCIKRKTLWSELGIN